MIIKNLYILAEVTTRYLDDTGVDIIHPGELTNNKVVKDKIAKAIKGLGYEVHTNKGLILSSGNPKVSRFHSSIPDLVMYHKERHCAFVIISTGTTESDNKVTLTAGNSVITTAIAVCSSSSKLKKPIP